MAETIVYRHDGAELHGILERPERGDGRAVLVLHEIDGIGDNVRRRARMLAELGWIALCADLYGEGRSYEGAEARTRMDELKADPGRFRARIRAGFDVLAGLEGVDPERVAAIGYCFGGLAALELARSGAPAAGVVSFHGLLRTDVAAEKEQLKAPILVCTGALDPLVPPGDVAAFQAEMTAAEADWQLIVYGRALHSFTNPNVQGMDDPRMAYDAAADRQSWAAARLFLDEAVG